MIFGYRADDDLELNLPAFITLCRSVKVSKLCRNRKTRGLVAVGLNCGFKHATDPHVDHVNDSKTARIGAVYRNGRDVPHLTDAQLISLRAFVDRKSKELFRKADRVMSFDEWLDSTNYSESRKIELRDARNLLEGITLGDLTEDGVKMYTRVKSFIKDEHYQAFKHSRGIYARVDEFKVLYGRFIKSMEEIVYETPYFIKHIPVSDRPKFISDRFGGASKWFSSDFTSFESHSVQEILDNLVGQVYYNILGHLPEWDEFAFLFGIIKGTNTLYFKDFKMKVDAKKCSGEMDTSLSNGLLNFLMLSWIAECEGLSGFDLCVEGDDSIGTFDSIGDKEIDFEKYGCLLKFELHDRLGSASFCGLMFSDSLQSIGDSFRHIARMCGKQKYVSAGDRVLNALARAKAMCLLYQYPNCPILAAYCEYVLRVTRGYDVRRFLYDDTYKIDIFEKALAAKVYKRGVINDDTRILYEQIFNITVQHQLEIEHYFDGLNKLEEVWHHSFDLYLTREAIMFDYNYTVYGNNKNQNPVEPYIPTSLVDIWPMDALEKIRIEYKC